MFPILLSACAPKLAPPAAEVSVMDSDFNALSSDFLEGWLTRHPVDATQLGDHRGDGRWPDLSAEGRAAEAAWRDEIQARLGRMELAVLGDEDAVDAAILQEQLEALRWSEAVLRPWQNDPLQSVWVASSGLDSLVTRDFAPEAERMAHLEARLRGLPTFLDQSRALLEHPPELHTRTAMAQADGLVAWVDGPLRERFPADQADALNTAADQAEAALRDYRVWMESDLLPRSDGEARLGPERFERKLRTALGTDMDSEAVVAAAWELLDQTTTEMAALSRSLYPTYFDTPAPAEDAVVIRAVLDHIAEDTPTDCNVVPMAANDVDEAARFVREHALVTLPHEPVKVIPMPQYKQGVAIAYCDASGPLEQNPQTFYEIAPPPADWPEERRASFYREYNTAMLKELSIHEAMPGHFVQLAHARAFHSPVRAVFASGSFIEGWALYAEWFMSEAGYGGPEVRLQRDKMVLRLCINAIIDHGFHAGDMTGEQATRLMMERGFQEEGEATGKWTRAQLTSTQLSTYLVGLIELRALRTRAEASGRFVDQAGRFDARAYHDALLAHGAPPPRALPTLLGL